jgi:hypothetical protein
MTDIKIEQVGENEVEVYLSPSASMEMVTKLIKGLNERGLVENMAKSTVSTRCFYRPQDSLNDKADQLIKSLQKMTGNAPNQSVNFVETAGDRRRREMAESQGIKYEPNKVVPNVKQSITGHRTAGSQQNKIPIPTMTGFSKEESKKKRDRVEKSWAQHPPFPSAHQSSEPTFESGEEAAANQLAKLMNNRNMFNFKQPSNNDFIAAGERMGIGANENMIKSEDEKWNNTMADFFREASKPISSRFSSPEEEAKYWDAIKIQDSDS